MKICGEFDCVRPDLERQLEGRDMRLRKIITECRNNISGADEDKSRDTLLTQIIHIAKGGCNRCGEIFDGEPDGCRDPQCPEQKP